MSQLGLFDAPPPKARRTAALRSFHARNESPAEALAGEARAARQEAAILGAFQAFAGTYGGRMTPSQVAELFPAWPLTSIRRALSTMTSWGLLRKHPEDRRQGPRGARECTWGLA